MKKQTVEQRIKNIEERNKRVEKDKAWETSILRRILITGLTYMTIVSYLIIIGAEKPFISAVVPAVGYFISTLVIKSVRDWWINR